MINALVGPKSFHHQFFARTIASGGPPGGLPAASADPRHTPALAARLAQARKKIGAPSLACGAHLLRKEEHSFIHHSLARFVHHYHSYFGGSKNEDLMVIRARRAESWIVDRGSWIEDPKCPVLPGITELLQPYGSSCILCLRHSPCSWQT